MKHRGGRIVLWDWCTSQHDVDAIMSKEDYVVLEARLHAGSLVAQIGPDLNPTGNLWAGLKKCVCKSK